MKTFRQAGNLFLLIGTALLFSLPLSAEISFSSLNLSKNDEILFSVKADIPGSIGYSTIFKGRIKDGQAESFPRALTCFPEKMEIFEGSKKLQIRNRYGRAIYNFDDNTLVWTRRTVSIPENTAAPLPIAVSATGKWLCEIERKDMFKGTLVITENSTGRQIVLDDNTKFSYTNVPVKWSPDGRSLIYEKNGGLYFCTPDSLFKGIIIDEKFRRIGKGSIHSVVWNDSQRITYLSSDLIFLIDARELASLGLYSEFIQLGKILGRLPQKFDPVSDRFWVKADTSEFIVIRGGEMISYYKLKANQEGGALVDILYSCSFTENKRIPLNFNIFWSPAGEPCVCAELAREGNGEQTSAVYTISPDGNLTRRIYVDKTHNGISVSPDSMFIAITGGDSIFIYSVKDWKKVYEKSGEQIVTSVWRDNGTLCLGGKSSVKKLSLATFEFTDLFASSATGAFWNKDGNIILLDDMGKNYQLSADEKNWTLARSENHENVLPASTQNDSYRVFAGTTKNALYKNAVYIRTLAGKISTRPLIAQSAKTVPPRNKASIIFDADENADSLNVVLAICNNYNIKCTFFFNGEFIRRYPIETKLIAESGHECAAVFFNNIDLTDKTVYYDDKFIAKGLARLEDEFFQCTGRELSLYWHAPFNKSDNKIRAQGAAAGYTYLDSNLPDIISINTAADGIISGSILYERFDFIINELFATGADIVTVSGLY